MKPDSENQKRIAVLVNTQYNVNQIITSEKSGFDYDMEDLSMLQVIIIPLLEKHGCQHVADELKGEWPYVPLVFKSFPLEILHVLEAEIKSLDPQWRHKLLSKSLSDMTAYEYIKFQEITASPTAK